MRILVRIGNRYSFLCGTFWLVKVPHKCILFTEQQWLLSPNCLFLSLIPILVWVLPALMYQTCRLNVSPLLICRITTGWTFRKLDANKNWHRLKSCQWSDPVNFLYAAFQFAAPFSSQKLNLELIKRLYQHTTKQPCHQQHEDPSCVPRPSPPAEERNKMRFWTED